LVPVASACISDLSATFFACCARPDSAIYPLIGKIGGAVRAYSGITGLRRIGLVAMMATPLVACADSRAQPSPTPIQAQPQVAQPDFDVGSASYVTAGCRDFIARSTNNPYAQGLCAGKVEAVAVFATGICAPSEATTGQMIRVVARYIDERPARLHENFLVLAREALRDAWPCRR
jgi:hypothetical protein